MSLKPAGLGVLTAFIGAQASGCYYLDATVERERVLTFVERFDATHLEGETPASRLAVRKRDGTRVEFGVASIAGDAVHIAVLERRGDTPWISPRADIASIELETARLLRSDKVQSSTKGETNTGVVVGVVSSLLVIGLLAVAIGGAQ